MRVALVHSRYSAAVPSGENAVVDAEHAALRKAGVEAVLLQTDPERVRQGALYPVEAALRVATGRGPAFGAALQEFGADVVHVHNAFPDLGERDLARLGGTVVVTAHNYRSFCANGYAFRDGATCTDCVSRLGGSWNGVLHGCYRGRLATVPLALGNRRGPAGHPLIARAAAVLAPSEQARQVLVAAGAPAATTVVSPHFLPDALRPVPAAGSGRRDHFVFVGRLTPEKGLDELLARWPSGRRLLVVGDGEERTRLSRTRATPDITFTGRLDRREVLEVLRSARALVFPSLWWETFGLVAMEALAVGTPVVSVGQHAVADLVREHAVGAAVQDAAQLGEALAAVDATDPASWNARVTAVFEERFTERVWLDRRLAEYAGLLSAA